MYFFKNIVTRLTSNSDMNKYLIVGIGNIGDKYNNTRHNIGFDVINEISKVLKVGFESVKLAQRAECKFKGKKIILIKPNNYVNNSGKSLLYWKKKEKVRLDNTLVICDDLNLFFGNIKIKSSGSAGGHNGLKDIEEFLGTVNYPRVRIGISNNNKMSTSDYVLGKWSESEQSNIHNIVKVSSEIVFSFIQTGIERTMNVYNKKNFIDEDL